MVVSASDATFHFQLAGIKVGPWGHTQWHLICFASAPGKIHTYSLQCLDQSDMLDRWNILIHVAYHVRTNQTWARPRASFVALKAFGFREWESMAELKQFDPQSSYTHRLTYSEMWTLLILPCETKMMSTAHKFNNKQFATNFLLSQRN